MCREGRARVRLVGSGPVDLPGVPVEVVGWREETEVDEIRGFDVGIMPLPDEPWARGKAVIAAGAAPTRNRRARGCRAD